MEKNFMCSDSLVELEFLTERKVGIHYHENFELLYVMAGSVKITVEESYQLGPGDMIMINVSRKHSYEGTENLFLGRLLLSYSKLKDLLGQRTILFWCNSATDKNEVFTDLRTIITRIFNQSLKEESGKIYLNSLYYQMLHLLTSNFLLTAKDVRYETEKNRSDDRIQDIFAYIRANYRENISLQDLADYLYLSPTYLSKYIKKKCNVNFVELINTVRLGHAMEDMLYTDTSVMKIAMDNGFASVAAFNKAFKEAYHMTPSEFRKSHTAGRQDSGKDYERKKHIRKKVEEYLEHNPVPEESITLSSLEITADAAGSGVVEWKDNCCRMINAGTAMDLTRSDFQEQILHAREKIRFEYVRFWDVCAPELFIDIHAPKDRVYFGQLDRVLDFLVKNDMKPYMELGFKPIRLLKNTRNAVREVAREEEFSSDQEMADFYDGMMKHFVNRYGSEEVETWYFEHWEKEERKEQVFVPAAGCGHEDYFHRFDIIAGVFRSRLPGVRIGGGGFPFRHYGKEGFRQILSSWKKHSEFPDFLSLTCYPYILQKEGDTYYEKKQTDADFVLHSLESAREVMEEEGLGDMELHVSEYSLTLSNRNAVNDSCIKGAFLMQNALSCIGKADMMGHWLFTDAYADFRDTQDLLFGGCGILTKNGIPKPAFYAFEFCSRLYKTVLVKEKHCMITKNDRGSFRIVCHNYKNLNYNYYMAEESDIHIQDLNYVTDDRNHLTIHFRINHVRNGCYLVRQNRINQDFGSIQDKWEELNLESELNLEEQEYLQKISTPRLMIQELNVKNGCMSFQTVLKPGEIQLLYITMR